MLRRVQTLLAAAWLTGSVVLAATPCADLLRLSLPQTTIATAAIVPAGSFTPPQGGRALAGLPAFCRVAGSMHPSSDSDIQFEVWMPDSAWNGKFLGVGNGGYAGTIGYDGLAAAVRHGYATASTDTGHRTTGGVDATWALRHPEKIVDFGHRAVHLTAVRGKAIVQAFYGEGPRRAYFNSCSNGGRQALMEAQRYPEDYDGIMAGAPANNWTRLLSEAASNVQATLADPAAYIPAAKLPAIQAAALAACDAGDGVKDGVIENPAVCRWDRAVLACKGEETDACLTAPQLRALGKIYGGLRDASGKLLFPGYPEGGEAEAGGWGAWTTGAAPGKSLMFSFGTQFFANMVYDDPQWDYRTFDAKRDVAAAEKKLAKVLNANDPDLRRFRKRGGKLILYHGWSDAAIPAYSTIDYFKAVEAKMGAGATRDFARLYMVPGMQHCGGGSGPNVFGQAGPFGRDATHDMAAALERWIEEGTAPEAVIATHFNKGSDPASGVARERPLCSYPQVARYTGQGSTDEAANFVCAAK